MGSVTDEKSVVEKWRKLSHSYWNGMKRRHTVISNFRGYPGSNKSGNKILKDAGTNMKFEDDSKKLLRPILTLCRGHLYTFLS